MKLFKKIGIFILTCITILSLFSCGVYNLKKKNSKQAETVFETTVPMTYAAKNGFTRSNAKANMANDIVDEEGYGGVVEYDRKIARSVSINAETKTFDSSIDWLKKHVSSFNGIIDNSYIDTGDANSSNYKKNAYFAIRIPANKLDSFLGKMGDNLNVTFKQENIVDVTEDYFDSESRLKSLKIEEENLNEILKKAKSVDEIIKVEDKLSEVRANIENINRRIKSYDKQVNYSRVDVNITEVKDLTEIKADKYDFSKETLNKKLLKTVEDVKLFLKKVASYIFINIPWIILGLIVIIIEILLYMIIKAVFFRNKDNKEKSDSSIAVTENDDKSSDNKKSKNKKDKKSENKEELSDEEVFDKAIEEVNKVVLEGDNSNDDDSDVEIEFYNQDE